MKETKRAYRRHHKFRMRARAKRLIVTTQGLISARDLERQYRKRGDTFTVCSCHMCCNPRHSWWSGEPTMQEIRASQDKEE